MKTLTSILLAMIFVLAACSSVPTAQTSKADAIKNYRAKYTQLFDKWAKSQDTQERAQLRAQIEDLKAKNLQLFVR